MERVEKKVKKNYILYERQDDELQALANKSPELDKSAVLRIVVELGLVKVRQSKAARQLIGGSIAELLGG